MKALRDREKGSKIFVPNWQCIPMNNDQSHLRLVNEKIEEAKHVQERKQIDRMLQAIVKERMFGSILSEERHLSS